MKKKIREKIKEIEEEYDINVVFAVESGSRLWGTNNDDSDYDVRFVFYHHVKEYLRITSPQDYIELSEDRLDFVGYDIYKFGSLLWSSNPACIEWLQSDTVYYGEKPSAWVEYAENHFNPVALYHHYRGYCKNNYKKYVEGEDEASYKKYLYVIRGAVNALYVKNFDSLPPTEFKETITMLFGKAGLNVSLYNTFLKVYKMNKSGGDEVVDFSMEEVDSFVEEFLADKPEVVGVGRGDVDLIERPIFEVLSRSVN